MAHNAATLIRCNPPDQTQSHGSCITTVSPLLSLPSPCLPLPLPLPLPGVTNHVPLFFFTTATTSHPRLSFPLYQKCSSFLCFLSSFLLLYFPSSGMQEQATSSIAASSLPSSSERSSSSALHLEVKEGMESDDEIRRVPEIGGETAAGPTTHAGTAASGPVQPSASSSKRRGRSPADKENKRLKRLLRNRVSAQQARERKKAYLIDLEARVKELETKNAELEERVSTLQNENQMLRQILKNTTASASGGSQDQQGRK